MVLRRAADFVLQSRHRALATAFICAFIPLLGTISILIAGLVTLRKGAIEGALVLFAATVPCVASYVAYPAEDHANIALLAVIVIVASNVFTWAFAIILRRFSHWHSTLEFAGLCGILIIAIAHLLYPDISEWWGTQLNFYLNQTASISKETQTQLIAVIKYYAMGFLVASVIFNSLMQVLVARWWQAAAFNPGGLRKELYQIRLSYTAGVLFVVALALSYWGSGVALDIMPVLCLLFCAAGLSVVHSVIALTRKTTWFWLMLVYLAVIWLFPLSIIIVSILALLDTWMDFRRRLNDRFRNKK